MRDESEKRSWSAIAQELCKERDPKKIIDLARKLIDALDKQSPPRAISANDADGEANDT